jgi:hypothetical protein
MYLSRRVRAQQKERNMSNSDTNQPDGGRIYVKPNKPVSEMTREEVEAFVDQLFLNLERGLKASQKAKKAADRAAARKAKADAKKTAP